MSKTIWQKRTWVLVGLMVLALSVAMSDRGQAGESIPCLSEAEARATFKGQINDLLHQIEDQWGITECRADSDAIWNEEVCVERADVEAAGETLQWQSGQLNYTSNSFLTWSCAAAAECWLYASMSCAGEVELLQDGED